MRSKYKHSKGMMNWPKMTNRELIERFKLSLVPIHSTNHRAMKKRHGQMKRLEEIILERMGRAQGETINPIKHMKDEQ